MVVCAKVGDMASTAGAFAQRKAQTLAELAADSGDFSRAGHVDERARPIVGLVNRHPSFFTTSSCAGRVSLFADPTTATRAAGMKGGEWVYVNHDPADADAIVAAVRRKLGEDEDGGEGMDPECTLVLRFEPFILSVEASTLEEGARLVAAARDAGYRESGITASDKRFILAVRCSIRMEVPVVSCGERLVTDDALRRLVSIANDKHAANSSRAERLMERFIAVFGDELEAPATRGGDRAAAARGDEAGETSESAPHIEGEWVLMVDKLAAKRCKDAIKSAGWLDQGRRAGASDDGKRVALPVTSAGAAELVIANSLGGNGWEDCKSLPALEAIRDGHAELVQSDESAPDSPGKPPTAPKLQAKQSRQSPAATMKAAALALLPRTTPQTPAIIAEIPTKWEKLGDLALLPSCSFLSDEVWTMGVRERLYPAVAEALGVARLARQAEVSQGPKRESRAVMLWDPGNVGGWIETKELGVTYGLDVTKVMFSSGNGTEKARMGRVHAAGETVVDLFAGIGYYTLQLLRHAGVAKVFACEWNPNSVAALRRNLQLNGVESNRCEVREGDNRRVAPVGVADRVLLGLLPDSETSWPTAVAALRAETGGVMHVHGNVASGEEEAWTRRLESEVAALAADLGREWAVRVEHVERVKWYAPRVRHLVADVRCVPTRLGAVWAAGVGAATSPMARNSNEKLAAMLDANEVEKKLKVKLPPGSPESVLDGAMSSQPVRRMHRPSPADFRAGPSTHREPCVMTGLDIGPAPWTWSPAHVASVPGVRESEVSVHVSDTPHLDFVRKNFKFKNMPFGELLDELTAEAQTEGTGHDKKKTWYYLRSIGRNPRKEPAHCLAQFPGLAKELRIPSDILWGGSTDDDQYFSAVLRCSSGGLRLWTHYDAMDNALIQLHGEKRVLLFPPAASAGLYLDGSSSPVVGPAVDGVDGEWPEEFPAYRAARAMAVEVTLQPGDVLFIPALWAHHVEALHGPSIAVNVFFRELPKSMYPAKDLYGNADPIAAGKALDACETAARELSSLPRDHRVFYGGVAVARMMRDLRIEDEVGAVVVPGSIAPKVSKQKRDKPVEEVATAVTQTVTQVSTVNLAGVATGVAVGIALCGVASHVWRRS